MAQRFLKTAFIRVLSFLLFSKFFISRISCKVPEPVFIKVKKVI